MRRRLPLFRWVVSLTAALLVTTAAILLFVRVHRVVTAPGYLAGGSTAVRAPWEGRVAEVLVTPGQSVHAGDPLLRLEAGPLAADLEQIRLRLGSLQDRSSALARERERLRSEAFPREREQAELALEKSQLELEQAQHHASIFSTAYEKGVASREQLYEAEAARSLAEVALRDAKAGVPALVSRQRGDLANIETEIRSLEARAEEEQSRLREMEREHTEATLRAEADGLVADTGLTELNGRAAAAGEELLRIAVGVPSRFDGTISDGGRASVVLGQNVKVRLEAYPWLLHGTLAGRVTAIAEHRETQGGYGVQIACDPATAPGRLHDGLRGQARIIVEEKVPLARILFERMIGAPKR